MTWKPLGLADKSVWARTNGPRATGARIVVSMAVHNNELTARRALVSLLSQRHVSEMAVLVVDDDSNDQWHDQVTDLLGDERVIQVRGKWGSAAQSRNFSWEFVDHICPNWEWLGRLDADDELVESNAVSRVIQEGTRINPKATWLLAGNELRQNGGLLPRINLPDSTLVSRGGLLERLEGMSVGLAEWELPSCNLWVHRRLNFRYPHSVSAEDHWLVAKLLSLRPRSLGLCTDSLYARYSLSGKLSSTNRDEGMYLKSRRLLFEQSKDWLRNSE